MKTDREIKEDFINRKWKRRWKHWAKSRILDSERNQWHVLYTAMDLFTDRLKYECMHAGGTLAQMYDAKNQYNV